MSAETPITETMTVREVMTRYPQAEATFNKYGLTGCGGKKGPIEPLGFFATVHHVDPQTLLAELNQAASSGPRQPTESLEDVAPADIYKPFVKTALATVITVGCSLGAINLAAMALAGVTGSYWEAVTQAHGHAQIFGWVGLFIMGIAYHVLPRLKASELRGRGLAMASFWLVLSGISLRMIAQPLAESPYMAGIVVLSALSELAGASFFLYVIRKTLAGNPASADFYDKYIVASTVWFWITAAATVGISLYTAQQGIAIIPLALDAPYLHVSLVGFVAMMIFGITLRTIPVFMGLRQPNVRAFNAIFWALNLSIVLKVGSGWLELATGAGSLQTASLLGSALEFGAIASFVYFLGIFGKPERDISGEGASRSYEKFVRAAYFWLLVAGAMSAAYAAYHAATGLSVPHSLVGAYRHALTVGFISLIIMGMAARIIPVFTGVKLHSELMLLGTFLLVNVGNTVRVVSQPLADLVGGPFFVTMGVSGFIEVTGLSLFVYNLWRTIDSPVEEELPVATQPGAITRGTIVADVLSRSPETLGVFLAHGFTQLNNPLGRRTLAKAVTVEQAAQIKGVDVEALLHDLNGMGCPTPGEAAGQPAALAMGISGAGDDGQGPSMELVTLALRSCYDPEIPVNIVDLGLVYDVRVEGSRVDVSMTLTAPGCPMGEQMLGEVQDTLASLPGVTEARVNLVFDPPWTTERMSEEAKAAMGMKIA